MGKTQSKNDQQVMFFEEYIDALIDRRVSQIQNPEYNPAMEERIVRETRMTLEQSLNES